MRGSMLDDLLARLTSLPPHEQAEIIDSAKDDTAPFLWVPNPGPQTLAYFSPADELLFGGEAGGGKSDLLIGLAVNEHDVSQIFRLQHNDRVALVRRLAEILAGEELYEGAKPKGYDGNNHIWTAPFTCGERARRPIIEFGAMSDPNAWKHYQGRPASAKLWDELTQFTREGFTTVNAWLRSVDKAQRTRVVAASNPPTDAMGLWVIDYWGPWLDPRHQNPAAEGELRFFTTINGEQVEVDASWRGVDKNGLELRPKSRTFIRSTLADNPDLAETGYANTLAALPAHLREALAEGKFRPNIDDNAWQVIPTEWIIEAQQRWEKRHAEFEAGLADKGPMSALGVDPAGGGKAKMCMAPRHGTFFDKLQYPPAGMENVKDPRVGASAIFFVVRDDAQVNIDNTGGWGAGPAAIMRSNRHPVVECVFSARSTMLSRDGDVFENKRCEYYWLFREALDPVNGDDLALPPDRNLLRKLAAVRWKRKRIDGRPAIALEPKEKAEALVGGESLDEADAVVLAWAEADALAGSTGREGFHAVTNRPEVTRGHDQRKAVSRAWRGGGRR